MKALAAIAWELIGLFVEDGALALAIVAVVILAGIAAAVVPNVPWASGTILLFGCLCVLVVNVMQARRR